VHEGILGTNLIRPPPPLSSPAVEDHTMGATIATSSVSAAPAGPSTTPAVAAPTSTPTSQGPTSIDSIDTLSTSLVSHPSTKRSHSDMVHSLPASESIGKLEVEVTCKETVLRNEAFVIPICGTIR
jgi:hypothetical protein